MTKDFGADVLPDVLEAVLMWELVSVRLVLELSVLCAGRSLFLWLIWTTVAASAHL